MFSGLDGRPGLLFGNCLLGGSNLQNCLSAKELLYAIGLRGVATPSRPLPLSVFRERQRPGQPQMEHPMNVTELRSWLATHRSEQEPSEYLVRFPSVTDYYVTGQITVDCGRRAFPIWQSLEAEAKAVLADIKGVIECCPRYYGGHLMFVCAECLELGVRLDNLWREEIWDLLDSDRRAHPGVHIKPINWQSTRQSVAVEILMGALFDILSWIESLLELASPQVLPELPGCLLRKLEGAASMLANANEARARELLSSRSTDEQIPFKGKGSGRKQKAGRPKEQKPHLVIIRQLLRQGVTPTREMVERELDESGYPPGHPERATPRTISQAIRDHRTSTEN